MWKCTTVRGDNSYHVSGSCHVRAVSIFVFPNPYMTRDMKIFSNRNTNTTRTRNELTRYELNLTCDSKLTRDTNWTCDTNLTQIEPATWIWHKNQFNLSKIISQIHKKPRRIIIYLQQEYTIDKTTSFKVCFQIHNHKIEVQVKCKKHIKH